MLDKKSYTQYITDMAILAGDKIEKDIIDNLASNSTYRTMLILESLSYNQGITLEELVPIVHLSKPTVFRFLQTLTRMGYVEKNVDNRYFLKPKLFATASRSLVNTKLSRIAQPYMEDLSSRTGETTILSILDGNFALYIVKIESEYNLKFYERIGKRVPLYCTAMGKIFLSAMDSEGLERFFETEQLVPYTSNTLVVKEELLKNIEKIRQKGYSVSGSEHETGHRSIAVPIYNNSNEVIAALNITWPMFRETSEKFQTGLELLQQYAAQISLQL